MHKPKLIFEYKNPESLLNIFQGFLKFGEFLEKFVFQSLTTIYCFIRASQGTNNWFYRVPTKQSKYQWYNMQRTLQRISAQFDVIFESRRHSTQSNDFVGPPWLIKASFDEIKSFNDNKNILTVYFINNLAFVILV